MKFSSINIQQLLTELRESGLSDSRIGVMIDAPRATVHRLRSGRHKTTSIDRAIRIANFHWRHFQKKEKVAA